MTRGIGLVLAALALAGSTAGGVDRAARRAGDQPELAAPAPTAAPVLSATAGLLDVSAAELALPPSIVAAEGGQAQAAVSAPGAASAASRAQADGPAAAGLPPLDSALQAGRDRRGERPGWSLGARLFDGLRRRSSPAALAAAVLPATGHGAAAGTALLPAAGHAAALLPAAMGGSYVVAAVSSVVLPLPETYATFQRGHADGFPFVRAAIGSLGSLGLGLINGVMLDKPLWGIMQTFIGLGMLTPFFVGLWLRWSKTPAAAEPPAAPPGTVFTVWRHHARHNGALRATLATAVAIFAVSLAAFGVSFAFVPGWLAAHFGAAGVANILLALQIGKALLYVAVFAPDVIALARGKPVRGFSLVFTAVYLLSVSSYTIWGFSSALLSAPGPLREQYMVHGMRNLCEALASGLSLAALLRARRGSPPPPTA